MENIVSFFSNKKKILYSLCLLVGTLCLYLSPLWQFVIQLSSCCIAFYFTKKFENKMIILFLSLTVLIHFLFKGISIHGDKINLVLWSLGAMTIGSIQAIRKKDKIYLFLIGGLLIWISVYLIDKYF